MYNTGWAKTRRALDCVFTVMAEISGRYWQILDRSGQKIILLSPLTVTQSSVKPHAGAGCWRHKRRLKASLRFVIAPFANLGDLDEILQRYQREAFDIL